MERETEKGGAEVCACVIVGKRELKEKGADEIR